MYVLRIPKEILTEALVQLKYVVIDLEVGLREEEEKNDRYHLATR
jgi:hypothetical protein